PIAPFDSLPLTEPARCILHGQRISIGPEPERCDVCWRDLTAQRRLREYGWSRSLVHDQGVVDRDYSRNRVDDRPLDKGRLQFVALIARAVVRIGSDQLVGVANPCAVSGLAGTMSVQAVFTGGCVLLSR